MLNEKTKYPAKITAYGVKETTGGDRFWIQFSVKNNEGADEIVSWSGTTNSEAAKARTFKALASLGCTNVPKFSEGILGGALDVDQPMTVTVQQGKEYKGQIPWEVKYINLVNDPKFQQANAQRKQSLEKYNADLLAAKTELGISSKPFSPNF